VPPATEERRRKLDDLRHEVEECSRCVLGETRTRAVFGEGDADADLMFVGEAPGYHEDQQGRPFVGAAGKLLDDLLDSIGLRREQVYIANVLKSRPPNNRDPRPEEIAACEPYLWRQIELIEPLVICTLGNFATKLLSGDPTGITRVHGRPQPAEIAGRSLYLYPIFHPAAALYTPSMLATLKEDIARLPDLLAHGAGEPPAGASPAGGREAQAPAGGRDAPGQASGREARAPASGRDVPAAAAPTGSAPAEEAAEASDGAADATAETGGDAARGARTEQLGLF
jgi:uracil-DNA glycosylase